jgi:RNA polymerase sigma-70 factor, ECF subfamily
VKSTPGEVTRLLLEMREGNQQAEELLIPLVYGVLRRIAAAKLRRERPGHSLQPTALVHDAYLRLTIKQEIQWESRAQFFALAAKVMRNILVDHARAKRANKRPNGLGRVEFDDALLPAPGRPAYILDLDDALVRLEAFDPTLAKVVEYRFFAGMTEEEIAHVFGKDVRTIKRYWQKARAWLFKELRPDHQSSPSMEGL